MRRTLPLALTLALLGGVAAPLAAQAPVRIFNTVKEKLERGEQVVGGTIEGDIDHNVRVEQDHSCTCFFTSAR
jgi:hypothetical protein